MTTNTFLRDIKKSLSPKAVEFFERLEQRPEVQQVLRADEQAQLAIRLEKIQAAAAAAAQFERPIAGAIKRRDAVAKRRQDHAEEAKLIASDHVAAEQELLSLVHQKEAIIYGNQRALRESADPRIAAAITSLNRLESSIRDAFQHGIAGTPGAARPVVWSNAAEVRAASEATARARIACSEMQLEPLTASDVEHRLQALFAGLDVVLSPNRLRAPRLVDGTVQDSAGRYEGITQSQGEAA